MKMVYFRGDHPNFGDELNSWLWPRLLPDFFDDNGNTLFLGIGSIISSAYGGVSRKIVFGAGYVKEYNPKPSVDGPDWDIYFVRGPRSARALNLPLHYGLGDAAILMRTVVDTSRKTSEVVSFMPHWESIPRGNWEKACEIAGINFIDPRWPVEKVIHELLRTKHLVTEAMHGAIVADAFRIPWTPVIPLDQSHREKWYDWAEALDIKLRPHTLWPSSVYEMRRTLAWQPEEVNPSGSRTNSPEGVRQPTSLLQKAGRVLMSYLSAVRLRQIAEVPPCLSDDKKMQQVTEQMLEKLEQLKTDYMAPVELRALANTRS